MLDLDVRGFGESVWGKVYNKWNIKVGFGWSVTNNRILTIVRRTLDQKNRKRLMLDNFGVPTVVTSPLIQIDRFHCGLVG